MVNENSIDKIFHGDYNSCLDFELNIKKDELIVYLHTGNTEPDFDYNFVLMVDEFYYIDFDCDPIRTTINIEFENLTLQNPLSIRVELTRGKRMIKDVIDTVVKYTNCHFDYYSGAPIGDCLLIFDECVIDK